MRSCYKVEQRNNTNCNNSCSGQAYFWMPKSPPREVVFLECTSKDSSWTRSDGEQSVHTSLRCQTTGASSGTRRRHGTEWRRVHVAEPEEVAKCDPQYCPTRVRSARTDSSPPSYTSGHFRGRRHKKGRPTCSQCSEIYLASVVIRSIQSKRRNSALKATPALVSGEATP